MLRKLLGLPEYEQFPVDPEVVAEIRRGSTRLFTPDIARLSKYDVQKVFVYDELMSDRREHGTIREQCQHVVTAFTRDKYDFLYQAERKSALPFPSPNGYQIKGEIVVVPTEVVYFLDKLRGNRLHYDRVWVDLLDPHRLTFSVNNHLISEDGKLLPEHIAGRKTFRSEERTADQKAWMYIPNMRHWSYMLKRRPELFDRVPRFEPKKDKSHWLGEYFKYQDPETSEDS